MVFILWHCIKIILLGWSLNPSSIKSDNNISILVIDDEYDIVNLIKQSLEVNELRVCAFTDVFVALDHFNSDARGHQHSIVISDIRMPGMNGYEFVSKTKEIDKQIKIILMSAFEIGDKEFHNVLPDIKVDAFLQKPFSIQQLNDIIYKITIRA
jgi:two-component system, response regulator, stage 0 sporulation protein F